VSEAKEFCYLSEGMTNAAEFPKRNVFAYFLHSKSKGPGGLSRKRKIKYQSMIK